MAINTRRELVAKIMAENPGMSAKEAMIKAGYSPSYAESSTTLTDQPSFKELINTYLPDKLLAKKHRQLLTVPRKIRRYVKGDLETQIEELDSQAVAKGLELAYKLKGSFAPEKQITVTTTLTEYLDMIQNGQVEGQKFIKPEPQNAEPITKDNI